MSDKPKTEPYRRFHNLLTRLARVPKHEIDEQERQYQREREALKHQPKKAKHA